ncbi:MAG: lipoprotein-releasing ABC transporter permease subunit [Desulfuromonadaceae bacterium]|nr:lipoprotein-releasing ABC transporter permease subunit [Desulfuromonadaceae bacterium]
MNRLFGYEWFISLRYLRARRKQTFISVISFISIAGVTLGVAALIVVLAVMTGFHDGVRQQILGNIPHILIQKHGANMEDYGAVQEQALAVSRHIVQASPFVSKEAMLLSKGNVSAVSVKGVDSHSKIFLQPILTLGKKEVRDLLFAGESQFPGIIIGLTTASSLGVSVGDTINVIPPLFTVTPFGVIPKMKPFRVVGIFRHRGGVLDAYFGYVSLQSAQELLDSQGVVTGLEIELDSFDHTQTVSAALRKEFHFPFVVRSWEEIFGSFLAALKLEKLGLFIVLTIIVLVAAFNIATTLIMVVMEKHKDIAVLRSLGATSRSIMKIFMLEGLIVGTLGTSFGTLLGVLLARNADPIIKWLERMFGLRIFDQAVYGMERFPSVVNAGDVTAVIAVAMTISLLATLYPAWRAARMDPAEALRYD